MISKTTKRQIVTLYANRFEVDEIVEKFNLTEGEILDILRGEGVAIRGEDRTVIRDQRMAHLERRLAEANMSKLKMRDQRDHYKKRVTLLEAEFRRRNIRVP